MKAKYPSNSRKSSPPAAADAEAPSCAAIARCVFLMPRGVLDGEGLWQSRKLVAVQPAWVRAAMAE
jgi:hypothetical protein